MLLKFLRNLVSKPRVQYAPAALYEWVERDGKRVMLMPVDLPACAICAVRTSCTDAGLMQCVDRSKLNTAFMSEEQVLFIAEQKLDQLP